MLQLIQKMTGLSKTYIIFKLYKLKRKKKIKNVKIVFKKNS